MLDLMRMCFPKIVEAHDQRWMAVYQVQAVDDENGVDRWVTYLAVEAKSNADESVGLPAPVQLVIAREDSAAEQLRKLKAAKDGKKAEEIRQATHPPLRPVP